MRLVQLSRKMIAELETAQKGHVKKLNITLYENNIVKRLHSDNAREFLSQSFTD